MSDTFWTALSACATAAAFVAVAWQSFLTRSAVVTAQRALIASEAVALDAARGRLDVEAPNVSVKVSDVPWPPLAWTPHGMPIQPFPPGSDVWHFPEKETERLVLQAKIEVKNNGTKHVSVEYDGDLIFAVDNRPSPAPQHLLWPTGSGGAVTNSLYLQRDFTIKELSENYEAYQAGQPLPHRVAGTITVHDGRDNGVTDTWKVELSGWPVEPHPTRGSVWHVTRDHLTDGSGARSLIFQVQPSRERTYWISRERGQRLPEPLFGTPAPVRRAVEP
ncbi:hypothetical protein [Streptomyces hilarionis]|uniref:hypothetical protein n=1 Tax=Streptomyces hilarionis TaxID=2839954 RepID=UPI00211A94CC|nr:hypothetical protein [Streptomyces hilarionis]MCQ9129983.1 hypothetical protein [Streptomyces hilarionis]